MALQPSVYNGALKKILAFPRPVFNQIKAEFKSGGLLFRPYRVLWVDQSVDYINGFMETSFVHALFTLEQYKQYIYPNRNNITVTLTYTPVSEQLGTVLKGMKPRVSKYRAQLLDANDPGLLSSKGVSPAPGMDGNKAFYPVTFQLIPLAMDKLRFQKTGGMWSGHTPMELCKTLLTQVAAGIQGTDDEKIRGIDMVQPDNVKPLLHLNIPHGTPVYDIPGYIQKKAGGIYNSDIGIFLHEQLLYVYPLYDTSRFNKTEYAVDFFIIPKTQLPTTERSYSMESKRLTVAITGGISHSDLSDAQQSNEGTGTMFGLASKSFDGFVKVEDNKATFDPATSTAGIKLSDRDSKLENATISKVGVTDNVAAELSKVSARTGQFAQFVWNNSDPSLLYPGMPMRMTFTGSSGIEEVYGCVVAFEAHTEPNSPAFTADVYQTNTSVIVFYSKKPPSKA